MHSVEKMRELMDILCETPRIKSACRRCGIAPSVFWEWLEASGRGEERFFYEWGGRLDWHHRHFASARRRNILALDSHVREIIQSGQEQMVIHNGQVSWTLNPDAVGLDDESCKILGIDRLLRDELGRPVPLTVAVPAASATLVAAVQALMPKEWGVKRDVNVTIAHAPACVTIGALPAPEPASPSGVDGAEATEAAPDAQPPGRALERVLTRAELVARIAAIDAANNYTPPAQKRPPPNGLRLDLGNGQISPSDPPEMLTGAGPAVPADGAARRAIKREIDGTGVGPDPKMRNGAIGYRMA